MLASIIIFGYLGYYCKKFNLDINSLQISGPGLIFITLPACLSTMIYPTMWIFLFFVTLILIGIDSEFGLLETISYFVEDQKLTWNGKLIPGEYIKALVCLGCYLMGLAISTRGGTYVIELVETFGFSIPASLVILMTSIVFIKSTRFESMIKQLVKVAKEEYPAFEVQVLSMANTAIAAVMFVTCFYLTVGQFDIR